MAMYIIAGQHRGRKLEPVPGKTIRPTAGQVREALFNILMHRHDSEGGSLLQGARFADLCCGSGAIGLEALSRGAAHVYFVDSAGKSLDIARRNVDKLGVRAAATFLKADVTQLPMLGEPCDILFCDPPYASELLKTLPDSLLRGGWLHAESLLIAEQHKGSEVVSHPELSLLEQRRYGQSLLCLYQPAREA